MLQVSFGVDHFFIDLIGQGATSNEFVEVYETKENTLLIDRFNTTNQDKMIVQMTENGYFLDSLKNDMADGLGLLRQEAECIYPCMPIFEQSSRNTTTSVLETGSDYVVTRVDYNNVVNQITGEIVNGFCRTVFKAGAWIIEQEMDSSKFKFAYSKIQANNR
jgi:hypothetical protein